MEQHVKEMIQIRQSCGTRCQVVCLNYIHLQDQRDKGFRSYKIYDKMNKELCLELETQGNLRGTTRRVKTIQDGLLQLWHARTPQGREVVLSVEGPFSC
jgi:hypothetical protein